MDVGGGSASHLPAACPLWRHKRCIHCCEIKHERWPDWDQRQNIIACHQWNWDVPTRNAVINQRRDTRTLTTKRQRLFIASRPHLFRHRFDSIDVILLATIHARTSAHWAPFFPPSPEIWKYANRRPSSLLRLRQLANDKVLLRWLPSNRRTNRQLGQLCVQDWQHLDGHHMKSHKWRWSRGEGWLCFCLSANPRNRLDLLLNISMAACLFAPFFGLLMMKRSASTHHKSIEMCDVNKGWLTFWLNSICLLLFQPTAAGDYALVIIPLIHFPRPIDRSMLVHLTSRVGWDWCQKRSRKNARGCSLPNRVYGF